MAKRGVGADTEGDFAAGRKQRGAKLRDDRLAFSRRLPKRLRPIDVAGEKRPRDFAFRVECLYLVILHRGAPGNDTCGRSAISRRS